MGDVPDPVGALRESPDGVLIDVMVTPNASRPGVSGYNSWRQRLEVRVSAEAKKSRANAELLELLAGVLGVQTSGLELVSGSRSHEKRVLARGLTLGAAAAALGKALAERAGGDG